MDRHSAVRKHWEATAMHLEAHQNVISDLEARIVTIRDSL